MSYDLYFWKQTTACLSAPENVIQRFLEGQAVEGIEPLPVELVIARIKNEFPGIAEERLETSDCPVQLIWDDPSNGCFIALPCQQYLCIEAHQATGEVLNRLIDLANEFDCPLYDPQTNKRYTPT